MNPWLGASLRNAAMLPASRPGLASRNPLIGGRSGRLIPSHCPPGFKGGAKSKFVLD